MRAICVPGVPAVMVSVSVALSEDRQTVKQNIGQIISEGSL